MGNIRNIKKTTGSKYLSYYEMEAVFRDGSSSPYYMASRISDPAKLKAVTGSKPPDGVIVYGVCDDKVVLIRQYRYPIGNYIYEFPAGLVEPGEKLINAAVREMYEETGLTLTPHPSYPSARPYFTTIGMTDESCGTVFGYCTGVPTSAHEESSEEIEVVLADRRECRRILREENVAIVCAYMLMHFIADEDPFAFLEKLNEDSN